MKKICMLTLCFFALNLNAQEATKPNTSDFKLDDQGLSFSFNQGAYQFNINGFVQPSIVNEKIEGEDAINRFNAKRTFFILGGKAVKEKVSFLIQSDYNLARPIMDAWVAYHPFEWLTVTGGQKQTFVNNREMTYREDRLQFTERGQLSTLLSKTGREFGLFVEGKFGDKIGIHPKFAITSGDGRNSFGSDSRDTDLGGMKIGGRLDIYPLGNFKEGNDLYTADLAHETSLKILVGVAASKNIGATDAVGEGHGNFIFYDNAGKISDIDYNQMYADVLMKYNGFSFLAEYANATASNLGLAFLDETATSILAPQQISEFFAIGNSFSLQSGYVTRNGLSFDVRYENTTPEFSDNLSSILPDSNSYTIGITKYFKSNNLKMQAAFTNIDYANNTKMTIAEFMVQIGF
jgi:hypothetical protein